VAWDIHHGVEARGRDAPGAPLVVDDEGVHTLGEVLEHSHAVAGAVRAITAERPTVAAEARNDWRTVAIGLAVAALDGTLALVPAGLGRRDAELALEDVDPDLLLASPAATEAWTDAVSDQARLDDWRIAVFDGARLDARERWGAGVLIGLTSGSTGRAKAIVHTEASLAYAVDCLLDAVGLAAGEAVGVVSPLSSGPAFCFGPYLAFRHGSPLVLVGRWDAGAVLERFGAASVRWFMGVPTHVLRLAEAARTTGRDLACLRAISVGGGPMAPGAMRAAEAALNAPLLRMFGMTECLGHTTVSLDDEDEIRLGTEGRAFPGTEHLVLDASGTELPRGETGEAFVRGPSLMLGYADSGRLAPAPVLSSGHFPTGDLVRISRDGILRVTGRKKNQIMRAGKGIDAVEVETAIVRHPAVAEVCVVAVPQPTLGEQAAALVVAVDGREVDAAEIVSFLGRSGVSKHKWPEHFVTCDELPRTDTGKLARARAAEIARERVGLTFSTTDTGD
jgi:acyl-CoA synthetase (AMP-forming)/AMP-acid ligase II